MDEKFRTKYILLILLLWQLVSVYLMAIGVVPVWYAWVNTGLIILFILWRASFEGLLLAVASIVFYVVLPNPYSDTLSMWRPIIGILFLKAAFEYISSQKPGFLSTTLFTPVKSVVLAWRRLLGYEKAFAVLFMVAVLSLGVARYPLRGAAQLVFLLNTFLVYLVVLLVVKTREQVIKLLQYGALSTGLIVALGYVQFIITLFWTAYYFWQFWALRVASLYYGLPLAKVLQYSNSWVTEQGEAKVLRMFSIMTSSHAFAMICVFFLAFVLPLFYLQSAAQKGNPFEAKGLPFSRHFRLLSTSVVLACLALILSGTRGVWAGMIPVIGLGLVLYYWKRLKLRSFVTPILAATLLVVILFEASPLLDRGIAWVRNGGWRSGTLERVFSIVDTGEESNAGRLDMWKRAGKFAVSHPLGVGYANFVVTLAGGDKASFDQAASIDNDEYHLPQRYITAHSLYLQLLVELSALGLLLFGIAWLLYFYKARQYLAVQAGRVSVEAVYVASVSLVFFWFLAYGVFDVTWLNDKILLYTFFALALCHLCIKNSTLDAKGGDR